METYEILIEKWAEYAKMYKKYMFLYEKRNDTDFFRYAEREEQLMDEIDRALHALIGN